MRKKRGDKKLIDSFEKCSWRRIARKETFCLWTMRRISRPLLNFDSREIRIFHMNERPQVLWRNYVQSKRVVSFVYDKIKFRRCWFRLLLEKIFKSLPLLKLVLQRCISSESLRIMWLKKIFLYYFCNHPYTFLLIFLQTLSLLHPNYLVPSIFFLFFASGLLLPFLFSPSRPMLPATPTQNNKSLRFRVKWAD